MKQFNWVLLFIIVLVSCAPSEGAIQTAIPILTVTPSKTGKPSQTPTKYSTVVYRNTYTPTVTPTLPTSTPIPADSFLLQEDFEDGVANGWVYTKSDWVIEKELDGNRYLSGSGSTDVSVISYLDKTLDWTDYAFESRVKFVEGRNFGMHVRVNSNSLSYYLGIYEGDVWFAQLKDSLGTVLGTGVSKTFDQNKWYTFQVEIKGDLISAYVDNAFVLRLQLSSPLISEQGGIQFFILDGEKFYFDDIKVWSLK